MVSIIICWLVVPKLHFPDEPLLVDIVDSNVLKRVQLVNVLDVNNFNMLNSFEALISSV